MHSHPLVDHQLLLSIHMLCNLSPLHTDVNGLLNATHLPACVTSRHVTSRDLNHGRKHEVSEEVQAMRAKGGGASNES